MLFVISGLCENLIWNEPPNGTYGRRHCSITVHKDQTQWVENNFYLFHISKLCLCSKWWPRLMRSSLTPLWRNVAWTVGYHHDVHNSAIFTKEHIVNASTEAPVGTLLNCKLAIWTHSGLCNPMDTHKQPFLACVHEVMKTTGLPNWHIMAMRL